MSSLAAPPSPRTLKVACVGNPNTGKSTLFNALAGLHARVGNYPGVTVEKKIGRVRWNEQLVDLIDLPGTYSLSPRSLDEIVSVDVLLGRQPDVGEVDVVICIADAANLERNLYLLSQVLDLEIPAVLVLNMWDSALRNGLQIDVGQLRSRLGIPVVVTEAHRRKGLDDVRAAVLEAAGAETATPRVFPDPFYEESTRLADWLTRAGIAEPPRYLQERLLLDKHGPLEQRTAAQTGPALLGELAAARQRLSAAGHPVTFLETDRRYRWARETLQGVVTAPAQRVRTSTDRLDRILTHRIGGLLIFLAVMLLVFQTIYTWAGPLMDACEAGQEWCTAQVEAAMSPGPLRSLINDGIIAGVGGVLVFLPQIALLFLFIAILEDCGYMARAAYMVDRLMAPFGLSGKSFLPLMSSFACAIPGIMATRVIESHRERMVTILIAPLMSCSARLPVYLLLIGAFIPATMIGGFLSLQALVLFAMSSLGLVVAIPVAWVLQKTFFKGEASTFVMELPEYKLPAVRLIARRVFDASYAFVLRAGTLIFATTILVWGAGYFPGDRSELHQIESRIAALEDAGVAEDSPELAALQERQNDLSAELIRESILGRAGRAIEPVVRPLGWDWRIGVGAIASFPAREVIIATLGTIYSLGGEVDEESAGLQDALQNSTWPDGEPVYNIPVALSVMVFFALCAQCAATIMVIRRETNSWRWPVFCFTYMTGLAYVAALVTYQVGMRIG